MEHVQPLDGELSSGGNPLQLLTTIIDETTGDLLWLRPDAWRMPRESAMAKVVSEAVASGRRSRAIYPVRALQEAPDTLRARARAGEQVRVISDLPTRLFVIGSTHAILPEPLGFADEPRLLVRQPALVESLILLFELMWDRAAPVPDLDLGEARPDLRRFLLQQLASGAKDEQIARALGISLRTVRRRVASLLIELGVDNRFQAGVEAVGAAGSDNQRGGVGQEHHGVRRGLDVPGPLALRAADLAVGRAEELLAGHRDAGPAQVDHVVPLVVVGRRPGCAAYPNRATTPDRAGDHDVDLAVLGVRLGRELGTAADAGPLPMATISTGWSTSTMTSPSTSTRSRRYGGLNAARAAPIG